MSKSAFILCYCLTLWSMCGAMTWIRHRWIEAALKSHLSYAETFFSDYDIDANEYKHLLSYSKNTVCEVTLNFRLYVIGEDDIGKENQVLKTIEAYRRTVLTEGKSKEPVFKSHTLNQRKVIVEEVMCISLPNFVLSVLFIPYLPSPKYIRVVTEDSSFSPRGKSSLFATAELEGILDIDILGNNKNKLEDAFLATVRGSSLHSNETSNIKYNICAFNMDDHFRLCSTTWNSIINEFPREQQSDIFFMPEHRMYNLCAENWVNFRNEHPFYDTRNLRVKMVSCQLSVHQFYLVASAEERGAVFVLSDAIIDKMGNSQSEPNYVLVDAYVRFLPILVDYVPS